MLLGQIGAEEKIILDFTFVGFDNYVYLITQQNGSFVDIATNQNGQKVEQIHKIKSGYRVIVPANWDVLIAFAPESNNDGRVETSNGGYLLVRAYLKPKITIEDWNQKLMEFLNLLRIGEIDIFPNKPEPDPVPLPVPTPQPQPKPSGDNSTNSTTNSNSTTSNSTSSN